MIVGGYTLDVYCQLMKLRPHTYTEGQDSFYASSKKSAYAMARGAGWHFLNKDVTCPECWKSSSKRIPSTDLA